MKKKMLLSLLLFLCILVNTTVQAQVKFYARSSEQQMDIHTLVEIDYIIENAISINDLVIPDFNNFTVLSGPNPSNASSNINGKQISSYKVSYLLRPKIAGRITIPPATALINNKEMRTATLTISVSGTSNSKSSEAAAQINEDEYVLNPGENVAEKIKQNMMVVLQVNKTTCFEGEPIIATYKLYTRLKSESRVTKRPSLNGFSVYDMMPAAGNTPSVETLNGKAFQVHIIRKVQLYALQAGHFELDEVTLENTVHLLKRNTTSRQPYNTGILQEAEEWLNEEISLSSKPISITVKALPSNAASSFSGAVGTFSISSSLENNHSLVAGEVIPFQVIINGYGNLPLLSAPTIDLPKGIVASTPLVKEALDKTIAPVQGSKVFTFDLVAEAAGTYTLPALKYTFFDPFKAAFITAATKPIVLNVKPAAITPSQKKQLPTTVNNTSKGYIMKIVWTTILCMLLLGMIWMIYKKMLPVKMQVKKIPATVATNTSKQVHTNSLDYFITAKSALHGPDGSFFYNELHKGIWKALGDFMQQPTGILNKSNVEAQLKVKGIAATDINALLHLLQQSEMALYAPTKDESDKTALLATAESVIRSMLNK